MSKRLEAVHERALKRMDAVWSVQEAERAECLDDRKFYSIRGAQWDDDWSAQFENAPKMEVNKTHKEVVRIFSDYRNNRISVDFRADEENGDEDTADALDGLYRADFEDCGQEATDNAFEEAVGGGMGAWRLRACYEDEGDPDNDYQRIAFEPITDADQRVFFDPEAKRQDKADAKWCIVLTPITSAAFDEQYDGKANSDFAQWPTQVFTWRTDEITYLGEYYEVEEVKSEKVTLLHPVIEDEQSLVDPTEDQLTDLTAQGWSVSQTRTIKKPEVRKYTLSGCEVLDEERIAGPNIPVIVSFGKRWVVENIERCAGHVRQAKDPQRIYNGQISQLAEIAAISPLERPIFDPEQVAGLENQWAEANIKRHPYSLARALRDEDGKPIAMGAIGKVEPPQVPAALAALVQVAGQDIAELIGSNDQNDEVQSNVSAQAIELVHNRTDAKTFIYLDNHAKAVRRCGQVWLGMCKELYVEEGRKMQALDEQGGRKYVALAEPAVAKDGSQILRNDYAKGKFKVIVDVGPSSTSRKDATVRSLVGMAQMTADQELETVLTSLALMNMDGEGIDDAQKWIRSRLVRMGVVQPTDEEKAELKTEVDNQKPDPQVALADGMTQQALAEAEKAKAGTIKTLADAEKIRAEIGEILAGMKREDRQQLIDAVTADADRLASQANGALQ
jgi:hypothetical protein